MDQEPQVFESEGLMDLDNPSPIENPQEGWEFLPLTKGKDLLNVEQRLQLLRNELLEIEAEIAHDSTPSNDTQYLSEVVGITEQAEQQLRNQGYPVEGDLAIKSNLSKEVGKALFNKLESPFNFKVSGQVEPGVEDSENKLSSTLVGLLPRVSKLEEVLGLWNADHSYQDISQALNFLRKKINALSNAKNLDALNSQVEHVNDELNMVLKQLHMLQAAGTEQKIIDDLFNLLGVVEQIGPALPHILHRLETIKRICDEGSRFNERVQQIEERQKRIEEKIQKVDAPELAEKWNSFKALVQDKFSDIEKRIKK